MQNLDTYTKVNSNHINRKMKYWTQYIQILVFIIVIVLAVACGHSNKNKTNTEFEEDTVIVVFEYVYEEFDLFEFNPVLYPIFDSILQTVRECPKLNEEDLIYCTNVYKDNDLITHISIKLIERKQVYCLNIGGLFTYKRALFELDSNNIEDLFLNTGLKVKFKCLKENTLMNDYNDGAMRGAWDYVIEDGHIKCLDYGVLCE